ncbi:conserved hypothetical protein [Staphylococcus capitis]|nr:conserved hypothetical protein [Staphylococcus capitis]
MMTIETERIYEISREQFYGVFQNAYPYTAVIRGEQSGQISCPIAIIEWENELKEVSPHQVKFKEDE